MEAQSSNSNLLKQLQKSILYILKSVIELCEKNNIRYVAYGGTCLGAVRHSGFIPWDDDADIAMPRSDYNRFIDLCIKGALPNGLVLQSLDTDPCYGDPWIRVRKTNTLCVVPYHKEANWRELGVFLDIFPFDFVDDNNIKVLNRRQKKIRSLSRAINNKVAFQHRTFISKLYNLILKPIKLSKLLKKRESLYERFGSERSKYVVDYNSAYGIPRGVFLSSIFESRKLINFESIQINVSQNFDNILKTQYGNYMELPPKEKRVAHLPTIIKL